MDRLIRALALSAFILIPGAAAAADTADDPAAEDLKGAVGVCVRWGPDPTRLAEVVVVQPSGDDRVDALAAATLKEMPLPRPPGDNGGWRAMSMGIGGAEPLPEAPNCDGLSSVSDEPLISRPLPKQMIA